MKKIVILISITLLFTMCKFNDVVGQTFIVNPPNQNVLPQLEATGKYKLTIVQTTTTINFTDLTLNLIAGSQCEFTKGSPSWSPASGNIGIVKSWGSQIITTLNGVVTSQIKTIEYFAGFDVGSGVLPIVFNHSNTYNPTVPFTIGAIAGLGQWSAGAGYDITNKCAYLKASINLVQLYQISTKSY